MIALGEYTYVVYLTMYALPLLMLQLAGLAFLYRRETVRVLGAILPPALVVTAWLTFADHFAITAGVWRFDSSRLLGWKLGAVPIEEALFFLFTNLLVACGIALLVSRPKVNSASGAAAQNVRDRQEQTS